MLPPGYEPLSLWPVNDEAWSHSEVDPVTGSERLAPFLTVLTAQAYMPMSLIKQLVYSDSLAWRGVTRGGSASRCRLRHLHGRRGVKHVQFQPPCGTWTCPSCAEQMAAIHLRWLYSMFAERETVRLIWHPTRLSVAEARALGRTRDRKNPSEKAWYVQLPLTENRGTLIAIAGDPGGALGARPWAEATAVEVFGVFRSELRLPHRLGVVGRNFAPSYSRDGEPAKWSSQIVRYVAGLTGNQSEVFLKEADRLALDRYGRKFSELDATQMDDVGLEIATVARSATP